MGVTCRERKGILLLLSGSKPDFHPERGIASNSENSWVTDRWVPIQRKKGGGQGDLQKAHEVHILMWMPVSNSYLNL